MMILDSGLLFLGHPVYRTNTAHEHQLTQERSRIEYLLPSGNIIILV